MKVVLFCGGLGTRLREYSETIPKPMVDIGYRPIIWHLMRYYAHYGHKEFILCLGYRGDYIKQYFLNYNECLSNDFVLSKGGREVQLYNSDISDWTITFVETGLNSNLGQRLKAVEPFLAGEWWRLFAPIFLHANLLHVGSNLLALVIVGGVAERAFGHARFLVLFVGAGIAGGLATFEHQRVIAEAAGAGGPVILGSIGASGAVYGVGAAVVGAAVRLRGLLSPWRARALIGATLPLLLYNASMGGNYQIASITALILLVPSVLFMIVIERFLKADVLSKVGQ